ncbi:uncharacterized protein V6R79_003954 [Siganus canaliculatus]
MAREAVCSSTHQANGMRPLYANKARRSLIGCVNSSVSINPEREPLEGEEEEEKRREGRGGGRRGHICPRAIPAKVFSGLRRARAKTCRLQLGDGGAYNAKVENKETLNHEWNTCCWAARGSTREKLRPI